MERATINGSYNNNPLNIYISKSVKDIMVVTVFVHGLYGVYDPKNDTDKINILTERLCTENVSNCVNYNSSRDFEFDSGLSYIERSKAFQDKTFLQEFYDLEKVIFWLLDNCEEIFGIQKSKLVLNIHGNSLGGTLAVLLVDFFSDIKKISVCGSGCSTNGSTKPILSSLVDEDIILKTASHFRGEFLLLQGGEDLVVPLESGVKILNSVAGFDKKHVIISGANHNFSKIYGVDSSEVSEKFACTIFDFIAKM
ncbi:MAG: alpha/beta hydrolase [Candidatus Taylorbacteria bacterium]